MIPNKQVQEILDAVRIEDVVEEFVSLRRRGVNLIGLCPFHNEKTPSFNVNPTRNIFKCFGCGKGGDAVTFLREHENLGYAEALHWLARKYNIEIEEIERSPEQLAEQQLAESLYIVNDFGLQHFQDQLFNTDEGKSVALAYFKQRGLREETIRTFGLGYAPEQRDLLLRRAKATGHNTELLKKVGLCSQDGGRDFFRGRVMFAIHNLSGKIAAFAGRTMSSDKTIPKYINSPETEIYVKNKTLYGAFQAKKAIRQHDECLLVEGYMDVISLHQAGIENVVASSGTSLTEGQVYLIRRLTNNFVLLYDGDSAGQRAVERGTDIAIAEYEGVTVKIVTLPQGEDPDSFVTKFGGEELKKYIAQNAKDFFDFRAEQLLSIAGGDPIKRASVIREMAKTIAKVPNSLIRSIYIKRAFEKFGTDESALKQEIDKLLRNDIQKVQQKAARRPEAASDSPEIAPDPNFPVAEPEFTARAQEKPMLRGDEFQERDIVRMLVQFGDRMLKDEQVSVAEYILADIEESLGNFDNPVYGKIASECHTLLVEGKVVDQHFFMQHDTQAIRDLAIDLLSAPWELSPNWEERWNYPLQNQIMPELNFDLDMKQALDRFKLRKIQKMCELNLLRIKTSAESGDDDAMMRYMKIQQKLNETRNEIAKRAGTVVLVK